jgi:S1-C subfamily serine protease
MFNFNTKIANKDFKMNDYFNDDHEAFEEKRQHGMNAKHLWIFVAALLLVGLLILIIAENSANPKVDVKRNLEKYRKNRQPFSDKSKIIIDMGEIKENESDRSAAAEKISSIDDNKIVLSVVMIVTDSGIGSGTLLSRKGYFLTNAHVVQNCPKQFIYFSKNPRSSPQKYFLTEIAYENPSLDLAVLKVVSIYSDASLDRLTPIKIGSSAALKLGDDIYIYGYPGIGGQTITLTRGVIAGFLQDFPGWIKTDANIAPGNSGGGAFNRSGEFIGVPTAKKIEKEMNSQMGMVRPIDSIKEEISDFL